jgi:hypothetical protein
MKLTTPDHFYSNNNKWKLIHCIEEKFLEINKSIDSNSICITIDDEYDTNVLDDVCFEYTTMGWKKVEHRKNQGQMEFVFYFEYDETHRICSYCNTAISNTQKTMENDGKLVHLYCYKNTIE